MHGERYQRRMTCRSHTLTHTRNDSSSLHAQTFSFSSLPSLECSVFSTTNLTLLSIKRDLASFHMKQSAIQCQVHFTSSPRILFLHRYSCCVVYACVTYMHSHSKKKNKCPQNVRVMNKLHAMHVKLNDTNKITNLAKVIGVCERKKWKVTSTLSNCWVYLVTGSYLTDEGEMKGSGKK